MGLELIEVLVAALLGIVQTDLLEVPFQYGDILARLRELALLHALAHVPMDEGPLLEHQIELVGEIGEGHRDGGGVGQHAAGPRGLGQISIRHKGWLLVVDANFETSGTPVHELNVPLGLDGRDSGIYILGHHITPVKHATGHEFARTRITLDHHVGGFETGIGQCGNRMLFMGRSLGGHQWGIGNQGKVDSGEGYQIRLELIQIHIHGATETQRSRCGAHYLGDQTIQIPIGGPVHTQAIVTYIVDGLVVHHEHTVRVVHGGVGGEQRVIWLHHGGGDLGRWIDGKVQLALLAVIGGQALHQQGCESRTSTTAQRVEDEESLQAVTLLCDLLQP